MDVRAYIESGILEAYVLDALPQDERAAVADNIRQYPEVAAEVAAIEQAMITFAESMAQNPPATLEEKIWSKVTEVPRAAKQPARTIALDGVVDGSTTMPQRNWQRAAIWILLAGSLALNALLWSQHNTNSNHLTAMQHSMDSMRTQQTALAAAVNYYDQEKNMLADTDMQAIVMRSMQQGHPMAATVYWSKNKGEAYLAVQKMPMPPKGMQYQMWVIQNGKPVSMGVLPNSMIAGAGMDKLPMAVKDGQAFAISLEKEGGSPTPTTVYVLGKV